MKTRLIVTAIAAMLFAAAANLDKGVRWVFEDAPAGEVPEGWSVAKTGKGPDSVWKVIEDPAAASGQQVLAQLAAYGPNRLFNLCVYDESVLKDLEVSVKVKAVKGKLDQGGGPVWRYQDANNYYICRHNPLEDNFRIYKVIAGKRHQLASMAFKADVGKWYLIRVVMRGSKIVCSVDGRKLDVRDGTITKAGKVGLWTKADAVTSFDDFMVSNAE